MKYRSRGVVGVDMAGDELLPLDPRHVQGFIDAKANGLHVTVHAGESGPAANVRQVIMRGAPLLMGQLLLCLLRQLKS